MSNKIWLSSPHMGGAEEKYVRSAFESNWIAPLGPNVDGFEKDICDFTGAAHAAVLSSGTAAIHLALILLDVKMGDEVICSSFTFSASVNPIIYQRAIPIFVDSEENTWNICPRMLEAAIIDRINGGKKPKAIVLVHLYGMPAQMNQIMSISEKYDIPIIEDAAEALGSTFHGKALGTFGSLGVLSFNGNKIITTSGGGALISNNKIAIEKARFLATQARDAAPHYQHSEIGYNYRMSNVCAGIGRGQMEVLQCRVEKRRAIYNLYYEAFKDIDAITMLTEPVGYYSNRWLSCILLPSFAIREKLRLALEHEHIESRPLWKPMHQQPVFEKYPFYLNSVSDELFEKGLCLPSGSNLSDIDLGRVIKVIINMFPIK